MVSLPVCRLRNVYSVKYQSTLDSPRTFLWFLELCLSITAVYMNTEMKGPLPRPAWNVRYVNCYLVDQGTSWLKDNREAREGNNM